MPDPTPIPDEVLRVVESEGSGAFWRVDVPLRTPKDLARELLAARVEIRDLLGQQTGVTRSGAGRRLFRYTITESLRERLHALLPEEPTDD